MFCSDILKGRAQLKYRHSNRLHQWIIAPGPYFTVQLICCLIFVNITSVFIGHFEIMSVECKRVSK